jgi:hypothetical protein
MEQAFLAATYEPERLKTPSTWSLFGDGDRPPSSIIMRGRPPGVSRH